jgi:hypothetical protein
MTEFASLCHPRLSTWGPASGSSRSIPGRLFPLRGSEIERCGLLHQSLDAQTESERNMEGNAEEITKPNPYLRIVMMV